MKSTTLSLTDILKSPKLIVPFMFFAGFTLFSGCGYENKPKVASKSEEQSNLEKTISEPHKTLPKLDYIADINETMRLEHPEINEEEKVVIDLYQEKGIGIPGYKELQKEFPELYKFNVPEVKSTVPVGMDPQRVFDVLMLSNIFSTDIDKKIKSYKKASKIKPDSYLPYLLAANAYAYNNQPEEAIIEYKKAFKFKNEDNSIWEKIAIEHFKLKQYDESVKAYAKAHEVYEDKMISSERFWKIDRKDNERTTFTLKPNIRIYNSCALVYSAAGEHEKALKVIKKSLNVDYHFDATKLCKAQILINAGREKEAHRMLESDLEYDIRPYLELGLNNPFEIKKNNKVKHILFN